MNDRNTRFDDIFGSGVPTPQTKIDAAKYFMEGGRTYNLGRILKDAGVRVVNAAAFAAYERGEIEVAPEFKELLDAAIQHNNDVDARDASYSQPARTPSAPYRSEWEIRDGTAE